MFTALDLDLNKKVTSFDVERQKWFDHRFICPFCGDLVSFVSRHYRKETVMVSPHFRHKPESKCTYAFEPETHEHMRMKEIMYAWLLVQGFDVDLEHKVDKVVADVYAVKDDIKVAVEVQASYVQAERIVYKNKVYFENDIVPLWIVSRNLVKWKDFEKLLFRGCIWKIYETHNELYVLDTDSKTVYTTKYASYLGDLIIQVNDKKVELVKGSVLEFNVDPEKIGVCPSCLEVLYEDTMIPYYEFNVISGETNGFRMCKYCGYKWRENV